MKRLLILTGVVLLALPLAAEEKEKTAKSERPAPAEKSTTTAAEPPSESPLAAAARRAKRGKSKSVVITNEMVKKSTGHVTTTKIEYMPVVPPKPEASAEVKMLEERAAAKAADEAKNADPAEAARKQKDLERRARLASAAENYEDGYDETGADPAQVERELAEAAAEAAKEERKKP